MEHNNSMMALLIHTPPWVWVLFAYLLVRGIKSLQPNEVPWYRALILPLVFLIWAIYELYNDLTNFEAALTSFALMLMIGFWGGWTSAAHAPHAILDRASGMLWRPGSAYTLILVVMAFLSKYMLSATLAIHPYLGGKIAFVAIYGGVCGLVDGAFWGRTLKHFRQAFGSHNATL